MHLYLVEALLRPACTLSSLGGMALWDFTGFVVAIYEILTIRIAIVTYSLFVLYNSFSSADVIDVPCLSDLT